MRNRRDAAGLIAVGTERRHRIPGVPELSVFAVSVQATPDDEWMSRNRIDR